MTNAIKWFVCGVVFGVGVKGGMALYEYAKSPKAKEHFNSISAKTTKFFNDLVEPKPE